MSGWSHGYNVSTGYTYGFYREMAPDWIDFALAHRGLVPPRLGAGAPYRYLELGSGQGFGLCLLAAANPEGEFVGIDFSPDHVAHSRTLAADLGLTNVSFAEGDFAELGEAWPSAMGEFDYVALHGIYSWVPAAIRHQLIAILRASVKAGGAVYVSFNAMPGWASTLPFQHMLRLFDKEGVGRGIGAIDAGRQLFDQLSAVGSGVTTALPALKTRIENTRKQPEAYLVQEYLHENWHPLWCSQVMGELAGAKLTLAASATAAETLLPNVLPAQLSGIVAGYDQPAVGEDVTDCLINQSFRRDLYLRGTRRRHPGEVSWREEYRVWRTNWSPVPDEIVASTAYGKVTLKAAQIAPLLDGIGDDGRSLAELAALPAAASDPQLLNQRLMLLIHAGWLGCGHLKPGDAAAASRMNATIASLAAAGAPYRNLAAFNLGSGIAVTDSEMLALDAYHADRKRFAADGATMVRERLARLGRRLVKDGQPLTGDAETEQIAEKVATFAGQTLPGWRTLGIVD